MPTVIQPRQIVTLGRHSGPNPVTVRATNCESHWSRNGFRHNVFHPAIVVLLVPHSDIPRRIGGHHDRIPGAVGAHHGRRAPGAEICRGLPHPLGKRHGIPSAPGEVVCSPVPVHLTPKGYIYRDAIPTYISPRGIDTSLTKYRVGTVRHIWFLHATGRHFGSRAAARRAPPGAPPDRHRRSITKRAKFPQFSYEKG